MGKNGVGDTLMLDGKEKREEKKRQKKCKAIQMCCSLQM